MTIVKRRLNKKALVVIILILYLIIMIFYYCLNMPVKNIVISGNNLVKDSEIITQAGLSNYPKVFKISTSNIKNKLENMDLIDSVSVHKNFLGTVTIEINEAKILFLNQTNNLVVLSNGEEVENKNYLGIPILINYVPSDIYNNLIEKMSAIDIDIIQLISEIEYNPEIKDDVVINDSRFILKMNDGNTVYIDNVNFANLNMYKTIYSNLDESGVIHLDSVYGGSDTIIFTSYAKLNEKSDEDELSE